MISAVVIAKNESRMIGDCLKSLKFADEIVIIDSGSTDDTIKIARRMGARVVSVIGSDYSEFRNYGLKAAGYDWLLYVDADERVSGQLAEEIQQLISAPVTDAAFEIPRTNIFLGREMHSGGWGHDRVIRLFVRERLVTWHHALHEQPEFNGRLGKLSSSLIHYSHRDLTSMLEKTLLFTGYEAGLRYRSGHPPVVWWRIFRVMITEFWQRFVRLSAWRDGPEGIIDGLFQVFNMFVIYARLWEMQLSKHG